MDITAEMFMSAEDIRSKLVAILQHMLLEGDMKELVEGMKKTTGKAVLIDVVWGFVGETQQSLPNHSPEFVCYQKPLVRAMSTYINMAEYVYWRSQVARFRKRVPSFQIKPIFINPANVVEPTVAPEATPTLEVPKESGRDVLPDFDRRFLKALGVPIEGFEDQPA